MRERIVIITAPPPALAEMEAKSGTPAECPYPTAATGQLVITVEYETDSLGAHVEAIQGHLETAALEIADEIGVSA